MTSLPPVSLPGQRPIPLLGPFGTKLRFFKDPVRCLHHLRATYGDFTAVTANDPSLVCVFGTELNRKVLADGKQFPNVLELPIPIPPKTAFARLTSFVVSMNGDAHLQIRRMMNALFQRSVLERYRRDIVAVVSQHIARWKPGMDIDLSEEMSDMALTIAFRSFFGLDLQHTDARELAGMARDFSRGATSVANAILPVDVWGTPFARFMRFCERYEQRLLGLIEARRNASKGDDALSLLLQAHSEGAQLSAEQLVGLSNELYVAGHETTASNLAWVLFTLERHPEAREEVLAELERQPEELSFEEVTALPKLDAAVNESLRLFAVPYLFFRRTAQTTKIQEHELPAGSTFIVSPMLTHRDERLYPEATTFKPQRWQGVEPDRYGFMPFGAGPRTCLGIHFASATMRLALSMILRKFKFSLRPDADISYLSRGPILAAKNGIPVRIHALNETVSTPPFRGNVKEIVQFN